MGGGTGVRNKSEPKDSMTKISVTSESPKLAIDRGVKRKIKHKTKDTPSCKSEAINSSPAALISPDSMEIGIDM